MQKYEKLEKIGEGMSHFFSLKILLFIDLNLDCQNGFDVVYLIILKNLLKF